MRLTCPNCGAQYEVPDEVIPPDGRDVQCSNCGDTWFQAHADASESDPMADAEPPAVPDRPDAEAGSADAAAAAPRPADNPRETAPEPEPASSKIDPSVSDILRQEADRETRLRASEMGGSLESQPDLGLDDLPDDAAGRRSREARSRMARIRDESPQAAGQSTETDSRRGLLPDIEEINSSLRASGDAADPNTAVGPARVAKSERKGGFARGFSLAVLLAVAFILVYLNAARIGQSVPRAAPALDAYAASVDQARLWLDAKVNGLIQR
jgi:predicted Zn finger-like uncharacterized protein